MINARNLAGLDNISALPAESSTRIFHLVNAACTFRASILSGVISIAVLFGVSSACRINPAINSAS